MPPITRHARKIRSLLKNSAGMTWRDYCWHLPIVKNKVFLESYGGNGLTCSPEAIFRYLAAEDSTEYTFVWVVDNPAVFADDIARLQKLAPFTVVKRGTTDYHRHLYTSQYLINNMSFPSDFVKKPGQTYLNTWHGVPMKKMGYDVPGRIEDARNIERNFLASDYLLSSSSAMTERMYLGAFKLTNVFNGTILEEGAPRTDLQADPQVARAELAAQFPKLRLREDTRKVVVYAPTWRGEDYGSPADAVDLVINAVSGIEAGLDLSEYRVLVKLHQVVESQISTDAALRSRVLPRGVNPNRLLALTDILVTDYSSIFYDFISSGRPLVHYVPDMESYTSYRDVYDAPADWPGIVAHDRDSLAMAMSKASNPNWAPSTNYRKCAQAFAPVDDGNVVRRVVDTVFHGAASDRAIVRPADGRQKMLIYIGPLNRNGITTAAKNLLSNISHDKFDVSVLVPFSKTDEERRIEWNNLDPNVRVLFRFGNFTGSAKANYERILRLKSLRFQVGGATKHQSELWQREWSRLFGDTQFDHLVDFTGYSPFWGSLFLGAPSGSKTIWQHNDLTADANRTVHGDKPLYNNLNKVFSLYKQFDKIVSVSEQLMQVNREALATPETKSRFDWSPNSIDIEGMLRKASAKGRDTKQSSSIFTFVNVGRLSPEKNQQRLINAFAEAQRTNPNIRLLLIGDGPCRADLQAQVHQLELSSKVRFAGSVDNPYPAMCEADCMVVSSNYEGQPMVILEALTLGLPVITTPFKSVEGAFPDGGGVVVPASCRALAKAMATAATHGIEPPAFDPYGYNTQIMRQFDSLFFPTAKHISDECGPISKMTMQNAKLERQPTAVK
jgi:CDP-glycerol glycerophosphotransferase